MPDSSSQFFPSHFFLKDNLFLPNYTYKKGLIFYILSEIVSIPLRSNASIAAY